jgi:glycosyltransferase involved in cell wall biosynthesis
MSGEKVLQVALSLNPGGTERLVAELATRLNPRFPSAVCCLDEKGTWAAELEGAGIPVAALGRRPGFHPGLGRAIAREAGRHGATVIHAHHYSPFVYACLAKAWRPGLRLVFTEHGRVSDTPPSPKRRLANRLLSRLPARVFAVSEHLKSHLVAEGFAGHEVNVLYNGIAVGPVGLPDLRRAIRSELAVPDEAMLVGTVARLDPVKDLGLLVGAVADQVRRGAPLRLVIVGDGPERSALETLAGQAPPGAVSFLGHRNDARRWLAGCDVYVNCSLSEGVSLTILEAMAAGLPVIATSVGGTPEVVTSETGVLIPARDQAALSAALTSLAPDPIRRQALGAAGRRRVEARFTIERMVAEYAAAYEGTD